MPPPDLEKRFLQPDGWQWNVFENDRRRIRYGYVLPERPTGAVVCLPGLSEFGEKYFEVARDCLAQNLGFFVIDWAGQGKSTRYLDNPHKRHSLGFDRDVSDLSVWIDQHIRPETDAPLSLLAHSMGGNIGLHYMIKNPVAFKYAALSAPMFGVRALRHIPAFLPALCNNIMGESYVPGGHDWNPEARSPKARDPFSNDEVRRLVHDAWSASDPAMQVGSVTFGWIYHAYQSCCALKNNGGLERIQTRCFIAKAGREVFVDNRAIDALAPRINSSVVIDYPSAAHEILMEKNDVRGDFLNRFFELMK